MVDELDDLTRELVVLSAKVAREEPISPQSLAELLALSDRIGKAMAGNLGRFSLVELSEIAELSDQWIALLKDIRSLLLQ
jgi:hypothetical protein